MPKKGKIFFLMFITLSFFIRLYGGAHLFFWHVDEDIIALTVKRILVDFRPQLVGFPLPGGIYIGPLFFYIVSIPYATALLNPLAMPFFSAILGTATVFLVYKVGSIIFEDEKVGVLSAIIFAFSFLVNIYSRVFTGLSLVGILVLFTYLLLYESIKSRKPSHLLVLGLVLLLASQNEGSSFSLIALTLIIFLLYRIKVSLKKLFQVVFLFIIFNIPLLLFEIRHNFFATKSFLKFFSHNPTAGSIVLDVEQVGASGNLIVKTFARFLKINGPVDIGSQILPCEDLIKLRQNIVPFLILLSFLTILLFVILQINKKSKIGGKIILSHLALVVLGITFYNIFMKGYLYEWILVILFPAFSLIAGYLLTFVLQKGRIGKFFVVVLISLFIASNLMLLLRATNLFSLSAKSEAVKLAIRETGNRPFHLDSMGSCYAQGYVYLFWYHGGNVVSTYADQLFGEGLIKSQGKAKTNLRVVMVNKGSTEPNEFFEEYERYKRIAIKSIMSGEIEILIVEDNL